MKPTVAWPWIGKASCGATRCRAAPKIILTYRHYYDESRPYPLCLHHWWRSQRTRIQHRIYFDENGKRIWEAHKNVKDKAIPAFPSSLMTNSPIPSRRGFAAASQWQGDKTKAKTPSSKNLSVSSLAFVRKKSAASCRFLQESLNESHACAQSVSLVSGDSDDTAATACRSSSKAHTRTPNARSCSK